MHFLHVVLGIVAPGMSFGTIPITRTIAVSQENTTADREQGDAGQNAQEIIHRIGL